MASGFLGVPQNGSQIGLLSCHNRNGRSSGRQDNP